MLALEFVLDTLGEWFEVVEVSACEAKLAVDTVMDNQPRYGNMGPASAITFRWTGRIQISKLV